MIPVSDVGPAFQDEDGGGLRPALRGRPEERCVVKLRGHLVDHGPAGDHVGEEAGVAEARGPGWRYSRILD